MRLVTNVFFWQLKTPQLAYNLDNLQDLATKIIQSQMAVTGVQAKISLSLYRKEEKKFNKKTKHHRAIWRLYAKTTI